MKTILCLLIVISTSSAFAGSIKESALSYIPNGKVVQEKDKEVKVQTQNGTIVEVEFTMTGAFEEASGDSIEQDVFVPGDGLLSLADAVGALKKAGKTPSGDWSLDKSFVKGWHYEFEGYESGKKMDYVVDAKTGKLLESTIDD